MSASVSVSHRTRMGKIQNETGMASRLLHRRRHYSSGGYNRQGQLETESGEAKAWVFSDSGNVRSERNRDAIRERMMIRVDFMIPRE